MSLSKPGRPRHFGRALTIPESDYLGWKHGAHVYWIIDTERRHGVVHLTTRLGALDAEMPWVQVVWDDGGVISGVPQMMTDLLMRGGWQMLSPSPSTPTNGDA